MAMAPASSGEEVEDLKRQANALFTSGSYLEAIVLYSKAIDAAPDNAVLYSNRSAASLRLGRGEEARSDALRYEG
jgi:DnaJ family protein C protein 7